MVHQGWTAAAVALAVVATAAPAWAQGAQARVGGLRGQVQGALGGASAWQALGPDGSLGAGDTVKTGPDGALTLRWPQGGQLSLAAGSVLRLQELNGGLSGRLMAGRARLVGGSSAEATLLAGALRLVAGPGTDAVVEKQGAAWRVVGLAGSLSLIEGANPPTFVDANQRATAAPGQAIRVEAAGPELAALRAAFGEGGGGTAFRPNAQVGGAAVRGASMDRVWATGLSALVPGVGQLYAGELPRGLAYLGLEFAFLGMGAYGKWTNQSLWSSVGVGSLVGLNVISPLDAWFLTPDKQP